MPTVPGNRQAATTMPGIVVTSMKWSQPRAARLNEESSSWRRRCRLDVATRWAARNGVAHRGVLLAVGMPSQATRPSSPDGRNRAGQALLVCAFSSAAPSGAW